MYSLVLLDHTNLQKNVILYNAGGVVYLLKGLLQHVATLVLKSDLIIFCFRPLKGCEFSYVGHLWGLASTFCAQRLGFLQNLDDIVCDV